MYIAQTVNFYSLLWLALGVVVLSALILLRGKPRRPGLIAVGFILLALLALWIAIHPRQTPGIAGAAGVQAMIGDGKPVLLEFQSPY